MHLHMFEKLQTDLQAGLSHDSGFATEHRPSHPWMRISLSVPSLLLLLGGMAVREEGLVPTFGEHGVWLGAGWWYWQESVNSYTGS